MMWRVWVVVQRVLRALSEGVQAGGGEPLGGELLVMI